jgi:hypothetical protein
MRGRIARKTGGTVVKDKAPGTVYAGKGSNTAKEAVQRKAGGKTMGKAEGMKAKMDMGRKPRKSGGRLAGNDWEAAQKGTAPAGRKMDMEMS